MEQMYLISDAAKKVQVESHVLRYWEEELELSIERNELGHRYYSKQDIERFQEVKRLNDTGIGLKAIKTFLEQNLGMTTFSYIVPGDTSIGLAGERTRAMSEPALATIATSEAAPTSIATSEAAPTSMTVSESMKEQMEDKNARLQYLLKQFIMEAVKDSNQSLVYEIKDTLLKELDYQFRNQEEREEKREENRIAREESYYRKLDETLRSKSEKGKRKKHSIL